MVREHGADATRVAAEATRAAVDSGDERGMSAALELQVAVSDLLRAQPGEARHQWALGLVVALLAAAAPPPPMLRDTLPPDLPLGRDGVPIRPLDDAELHRLLLALSATNEAAAALLAACHASGRGYGMPGWRECIAGR